MLPPGMREVRVAFLRCGLSCRCWCQVGVTFGAVDPHPQVSIDPQVSRSLGIDLGRIADEATCQGLHVDRRGVRARISMSPSFATTLRKTASRNAVARSLRAERLGAFQAHLRFWSRSSFRPFACPRTQPAPVADDPDRLSRAHWVDDTGRTLAQAERHRAARVIPPRTGPRHIEDAVEVLLEQAFEALAESPGRRARRVAKRSIR